MSGKSGHSHTGTVHRYYSCFNAPKKCDRKNVRKEWIDQIESGTSSSNIAERLTKRESQLEDLMKQLRKEQAKQKPLDPQVIRNYLEMLRTRDLDDLEQQKMLIRAFVDRIYLYDDHFDLLLNSSSRGGNATHKTEEEVKSYFFSQGSPSAHRGVPTRICSFNIRLHVFFITAPEDSVK